MLETRAHVLKAKQIKQHVPAGVRYPDRYQLPVCIVCQLVGFINSHLNRNVDATSLRSLIHSFRGSPSPFVQNGGH